MNNNYNTKRPLEDNHNIPLNKRVNKGCVLESCERLSSDVENVIRGYIGGIISKQELTKVKKTVFIYLPDEKEGNMDYIRDNVKLKCYDRGTFYNYAANNQTQKDGKTILYLPVGTHNVIIDNPHVLNTILQSSLVIYKLYKSRRLMNGGYAYKIRRVEGDTIRQYFQNCSNDEISRYITTINNLPHDVKQHALTWLKPPERINYGLASKGAHDDTHNLDTHTRHIAWREFGYPDTPEKQELYTWLNKAYRRGVTLSNAPDYIKDNTRIVREAIKQNCYAFMEVSDRLKDDFDTVLLAVKGRGKNLQYASNRLRSNYDIVLTAVKEEGMSLCFALGELNNNYDIVLEAVKRIGFALKCASDELKDNDNIVWTAVRNKGSSIQYASNRLRDNEELCLVAVRKNGYALEYLGHLDNNYDIVLTAVQSNGYALQFASLELRNNQNIVLAAINSKPFVLEDVSDELKNNPDIVLAAVRKDGRALQFASNNLRNNYEIVLAAVKQNPLAFTFASQELRNNPEIRSLAENNINIG